MRLSPSPVHGPLYPWHARSYTTTRRHGEARMNVVHMVVGIAALALTGAAALLGAWGWWRVARTQLFWWLLRAGQATIVLTVLLGGIDDLGHHKAPGLHVLYGVLPMLVSLIAEQLRAS